MDFASVLNVAQKNAKSGTSSETRNFYSTRFEPPKKESKEKKLSNNIKKFLAQKEEEERRKEREAKQKYTELMAQRSEKDKNKIKKMLKVTKSANKSVLADAVNTKDTAITLEGPEQPDEDDYGYVSVEASSIYKNLMDKYKTIPEEKKFSDSNGRPSSHRDLLSTKDRVRAAILKEREEEKLGRKRSSHHSSGSSSATSSTRDSEEHRHRSRKNLYDPYAERQAEERRRQEEEEERRKHRFKKPPPPIMDFKKLLQLAEQKQLEPLEIEVPVKSKEPERLLTKKEKREIEERKAYLAEKERRQNPGKSKPAEQGKPVNIMAPNGRIPKLNSNGASTSRPQTANLDIRKPSSSASSSSSLASKHSYSDKSGHRPSTISTSHSSANKSNMPPPSHILKSALSGNSKSMSSSSTSKFGASSSSRDSKSKEAELRMQDKKREINSKNISSRPASSKDARFKEFSPRDSKTQHVSTKNVKTREFPPKDVKTREVPSKAVKTREFPPKDIKTREFPPKDIKTREFPPKDIKTREFPPKDIKTREFPPKDIKSREFPPKDVRRNGSSQTLARKPQMPSKRRIDDYYDDDSEYDSEMDDFIDDGDDYHDYSRHIKEIFGYDKSRYRYADDDVDDMESSFAQQQKEEYLSKKIGLMEDLEDMRLEAEEKKRKAKRRRLADDD